MYQRQVSSRPRSVPATRSSIVPAPPSTSRTRLSIIGVTGWPVIAGGVPGLEQRGEQRRRGSSRCARAARPLSKTESVLSDAPAITNGAHSRPAYAGSENRLTPGRGDLLADPGAAAAAAVDRLALVGDAGAGAPVGVDHQVGDRRSAAGSCRSGRRAGRSGARPSRAAARPSRPSPRASTSGSRGWRRRPRRCGSGRRVLAGAGVVAGRLDVAQPQPGARSRGRSW